MIEFEIVKTPVGDILIIANDKELHQVILQSGEQVRETENHWRPVDNLLGLKKQIDEFFEGKRRQFCLPAFSSGTEFQQSVWRALCEIPPGTTLSYQELANRLGKPKAVRAVASANAKNPLALVVPCHRVIGKDGALRGYAGGLKLKEKLIKLEADLYPELN